MMRSQQRSLGHAFRRAAVPLGCYYTVTLLMPLANGAAQSGGAFVNHASIVLLVPLLLTLAFCVIAAAARSVAQTKLSK